jgi:uncharacterized protein (DUF1697 family)
MMTGRTSVGDGGAGAVHVALLRGVNLGGYKLVAMPELREFVARLGFADVRSLIQSGNHVFSGNGPGVDGAQMERLFEREAEKRLGLKTDFFVRSAADWGAIIAGNPFPDEADRDPGHLVVVCLKGAPNGEQVEALRAAIKGPEVVHVEGRHAYIVYPAGQGQSRLTTAVIDRMLGTRGTARNWNTVLKLGELVGA